MSKFSYVKTFVISTIALFSMATVAVGSVLAQSNHGSTHPDQQNVEPTTSSCGCCKTSSCDCCKAMMDNMTSDLPK